MRWWEKKRLLFNLIIVGIIILAIIDTYSHFTIRRLLSPSFFIQSILYFIFLNICYCAGWGVHFLRHYYLNSLDNSKTTNITLFVIGTLITAFFSFDGYSSFFHVYHFWLRYFSKKFPIFEPELSIRTSLRGSKDKKINAFLRTAIHWSGDRGKASETIDFEVIWKHSRYLVHNSG